MVVFHPDFPVEGAATMAFIKTKTLFGSIGVACITIVPLPAAAGADVLAGVEIGAPLPPNFDRQPDGTIVKSATIIGVKGGLFAEMCGARVHEATFQVIFHDDASNADYDRRYPSQKFSPNPGFMASKLFDDLNSAMVAAGWELSPSLGLESTVRTKTYRKSGNKRVVGTMCGSIDATRSGQGNTMCQVNLMTISPERCTAGL